MACCEQDTPCNTSENVAPNVIRRAMGLPEPGIKNVKVPPVAHQLDNLTEAIGILDRRLAALIGQLEPVLGPHGPQQGENPQDEAMGSEVVRRLEFEISKILSMSSVVQAVTDRLEV